MLSKNILVCILLNTIAMMGACFGNVCPGTRNGLSTNTRTNISIYIIRYIDCIVIDNNLEINFFAGSHPDTSFLDTIEEVKGYILFVGNNFQNFTMENLKIVRGNYLFEGRSIYIEGNNNLNRVIFPSLREILNGDVTFKSNLKLCFVNTIQWDDIVHESYTNVSIETSDDCALNGKECDEKCESKSCWSEDFCQKFRLKSCKSKCQTGCLGDEPDVCCDVECVAGCTGTATNCMGCRNFNNNGVCVAQCPYEMEYNETLATQIPTATSKFHYQKDCVDKCPPSTVQFFSKCVNNCPENYYIDGNICKEDEKDISISKTCTTNEFFTKENLKDFVNCTIIEGHFQILASLNVEDLLPHLQQFSTVEVITGFLIIQGLGEGIEDLSFFENLRVIKGQRMDMVKNAAFMVMGTKLKSLNIPLLERVENDRMVVLKNDFLESFDLPSLKYIHGSDKGVAFIKENKALCYVTNETFKEISETNQITLYANKDEQECEKENKVCHEECFKGCWGPGKRQCRSCKNFLFQGECLESCNDYIHLFADGDVCKKCDIQCETGCYGEGPSKCTACLKTKDGSVCPGSCIRSKYSNPSSSTCEDCNPLCKDGCTGPLDTLEIGGCNNCYLMHQNNRKCLQTEKFDCERWPGFIKYENMSVLDTFGRSVYDLVQVCIQCHHQCKKCSGEGDSSDVCKCRRAEYGGLCVDECPIEHYVDNRKKCQPWVWTYDSEAQVLLPGPQAIFQDHLH